MNCPYCGAAYEQIFAMGQVAPVSHVATCGCPPVVPGTSSGSYGRNFQFKTTTTTTFHLTPTPAPVPEPEPQEPLKPAEEIVADMLELLDELDDE